MKIANILIVIKNTKISTLEAFSSFLPVIIIVFWAFVAGYVFENKIHQSFHVLIMAVCAFIAGTGGLFQIIKKEATWVMGKTVKGKPAILSGILLIFLFWGLGALGLCFYLSELITTSM